MSQAEPSIKGSIVQVTAEELRDLVRRGALDEARWRAALSPEAASLAFDESVQVAAWYPVRVYDEILRQSVATLGGGRIDSMAESGRRTARALAEKGLYGQLSRRADGRADPAFVRLVITLSKAIYNFTTWELRRFEDGFFEIAISGAQDYPDTLMWRNVGFVEVATALATGERWVVHCERRTRERIQLLVTRASPSAAAG